MAVEFDPNEYFSQPGHVPAQPSQPAAPQYQPQVHPGGQAAPHPAPQAAPQPYAPPQQSPYPAQPPAPQAAPQAMPAPQYQPHPAQAPAPQHAPVPQYQPQHQAPAPQQFQYTAPQPAHQAQPYQPAAPVSAPEIQEEAPKKGLLGRLKSKKPKTKAAKPAKVRKERAPKEGGNSGFLRPYLLGLLSGAALTFGGLMLLGGPAAQQPTFDRVAAQVQPVETSPQVAEIAGEVVEEVAKPN